MHSAEKITSRILSEARQAADIMIKDAQNQAEKELAEARAQADEFLKLARKEAIRAAEEQKKRRLSTVESELRMELLKTRRALLDDVFEQVLDRLATMKADEQVAFLSPLIVEASPKGEGEIYLAQQDTPDFGEKLIAAATKLYGKNVSFKIAPKRLNARGGFILRIGDIEYNNTYEALIKLSKEELERMVVQLLFDADSQGSTLKADS